jgi:hypothetical protein
MNRQVCVALRVVRSLSSDDMQAGEARLKRSEGRSVIFLKKRTKNFFLFGSAHGDAEDDPVAIA